MRVSSLLLLLALGAVTAPAIAADAPLPLIPMPAHVTRQPGSYVLHDGAILEVQGDDPAVQDIADGFASLLSDTRGLQVNVQALDQPNDFVYDDAPISFQLVAGDVRGLGPEGYRLQVGSGGIKLSAGTPAGLFYGSVTLWQLLTADSDRGGSITLPNLDIEDQPRFAWRGLMLDSARHFQSVAEIEKLIDWMALHKLNVLQWHLTDDQGWRLEIRRYPKLTEVGGCRAAVGPDAALTGSPDTPYCGYYTQADAREVVRYAASRYIRVVPEIEMPGHAQAAIAAYPRFGVTGTQPGVSTDWGIHPYLYSPDGDTLRFLQDVLDQVMDIFPSPYIDVGGDEALKDQWQASPTVQAQIQALGLKDADALQGWFIKQMQIYLSAHGRKLVGWDEILQGGLPPEATVMSWHGAAQLKDAIAQGHDVILAYAPTLYLDELQSDAHDEPPGRPPVVSLQDVYGFDPLPPGSDAATQTHVLGAQMNLWSEYMPTFQRDQHAIFPRLAALAELSWSPESARDWPGFLSRLPAELARYRSLGIRYADSAFAPRFDVEPLPGGKLQVTLSSQTGSDGLRYTLDGSTPTPASARYTAPLKLTPPLQLRAARFAPDGSLLAARGRKLDANTLFTRNSDQLTPCSGKLVLRIEDDRPLTGERPVYKVDIMDTCTQWKAAALDGVQSLSVTLGEMPWNYQLAHDVTGVVVRPAPGGDALEVRADGCDKPPLAQASLTAAAANPLQSTLSLTLPALKGVHDLCFVITGDPKQGLWAIDRVQLLH